MKISGFSFCRNAQKLYYPLVESIRFVKQALLGGRVHLGAKPYHSLRR